MTKIVLMQRPLSLFYRYYFGRCSSELAKLLPLPYSGGNLIKKLTDINQCLTDPANWCLTDV